MPENAINTDMGEGTYQPIYLLAFCETVHRPAEI